MMDVKNKLTVVIISQYIQYIKSLCCTTETIIMLCINYILIKKQSPHSKNIKKDMGGEKVGLQLFV